MKGKTLKNIIIILVIFIVGVLVYGIFFSDSLEYKTGFNEVFSSFDIEGESAETNAASSNVLSVLRSVENIDLNNNVFSNPSFASLRDKSIVLPTIDLIGREDIFSPVQIEEPTGGQSAGEDEIENFESDIGVDTIDFNEEIPDEM